MKLPSAHRAFEAVEAQLPGPLLELMKRRYRRERRTRPLHSGHDDLDEVRRRAPRVAAIGEVAPLPFTVRRFGATAARPEHRPDVCLVGPGPLDPVLDTLFASEREAIPLVCVASSAEDLGSEVAGCATALVVPSEELADQAAHIVPREFVAVGATAVATRGLPVAALRASTGTQILVEPSDARSRTLSAALHGGPAVVQLGTDATLPALVSWAEQAVALLVPGPDAPGHVWSRAAVLAACGVPIVGDTASDHPLHGLVASITANDLLPADPIRGLQRLATDATTARIAAVRSRRYALAHLSAGAFVRRILRLSRLPTTAASVSVVVRVNDRATLSEARASLTRQRLEPHDVVVVAPVELLGAVRPLVEALPWTTRVVAADQQWLKRAVRATSGRYLAFLDARHGYGPDHLGDLLASLESTGASMVGRHAHFGHDTESGRFALVPGVEEGAAEHLVPGSTLTVRNLAIRCVGDRRVRSELDLQRRLRHRGGELYALHPFGFLRRGDLPEGTHGTVTDVAWHIVFPEGDGGTPLATIP